MDDEKTREGYNSKDDEGRDSKGSQMAVWSGEVIDEHTGLVQLKEIDYELSKFDNVKVKWVNSDNSEVMPHHQESKEKETNGPGSLGLSSSPVVVKDKGKNKEKGWVRREQIHVEPTGQHSSILSKRAFRDENVETEEIEGSKKKVQLKEIDYELSKFDNVKVKWVNSDNSEVMPHHQESKEKETNGPGSLGLSSSPVVVKDKGKNKEKGWVRREQIHVEPTGQHSSILSKRAFRDENVETEEIEGSKKKLKFDGCFTVPSNGKGGGLTLLWKEEDVVWVDNFSHYHIDAIMQGGLENAWRLIGFYDELETSRRIEGRNMLHMLNSKPNLLWCCFGDFNELLEVKDKNGGAQWLHNLMQSFCDVPDECSFVDLGYSGPEFTLHGHQRGEWIWECLDRGVDNYD
nr:hypothetical protein CFP56_65648 [Quercus suber]